MNLQINIPLPYMGNCTLTIPPFPGGSQSPETIPANFANLCAAIQAGGRFAATTTTPTPTLTGRTVDLLSQFGVAILVNRDNNAVVLRFPTRRVDLDYRGYGATPILNVKVPDMYYLIIWRNGTNAVSDTRLLLAEPTAFPRLDHIIGTPWPFGNVYADGKICWGSVVTGVTPLTLGAIDSAFLGTNTNFDLWGLPGTTISAFREQYLDCTVPPVIPLDDLFYQWDFRDRTRKALTQWLREMGM